MYKVVMFFHRNPLQCRMVPNPGANMVAYIAYWVIKVNLWYVDFLWKHINLYYTPQFLSC